MERRGLNGRETAALLDVHYTIVSKWANGTRLPGREYALRIERVTGIVVEAWSPTPDGKRELAGAGIGRNVKSAKR